MSYRGARTCDRRMRSPKSGDIAWGCLGTGPQSMNGAYIGLEGVRRQRAKFLPATGRR